MFNVVLILFQILLYLSNTSSFLITKDVLGINELLNVL